MRCDTTAAGGVPEPPPAAGRSLRTAPTSAGALDLLVATRTTPTGSSLLAHAVPDFGPLAATAGLTLCDLLAGDEVLVVPDLQWADVAPEQRCVECSQAARSGHWA